MRAKAPLNWRRWGYAGRLRLAKGIAQGRTGGMGGNVASEGYRRLGSRSISRVLSWTAIPLGVLLPARSSSLPGSSASHAHASLFGLAPDGVCRAVRVTTAAVSSYLAVSPLPALAWTRTSAVCFLLHFPSPHGARSLTGILLYGARTFLSARGGDLLPSGCLTDFPR